MVVQVREHMLFSGFLQRNKEEHLQIISILAIRLHECGDFDIIYNWGNATGWSATAGCENAAGDDATLITGSPTLDYPSVGSGETDDEVYHFYYLNQPTYDLSVTDINVNRVIQNNSNTTVKGTVTNNGSQAITSFDINYSIDGGAAVTSNLYCQCNC